MVLFWNEVVMQFDWDGSGFIVVDSKFYKAYHMVYYAIYE